MGTIEEKQDNPLETIENYICQNCKEMGDYDLLVAPMSHCPEIILCSNCLETAPDCCLSPRPSLADQVISQLEAWQQETFPRNTYLYGDKGEFYVRWTPAIKHIPARFTLANVTVYEEYRGQGIFKEILKRCCESEVPVIRLECIQNPRLAAYAQKTTFPRRINVESGGELRPTTMDWVVA